MHMVAGIKSKRTIRLLIEKEKCNRPILARTFKYDDMLLIYRSISFFLFNQKPYCSLAFYSTITFDSYIPPTFSHRECFYHL